MSKLLLRTARDGTILRRVTEVEDEAWFLTTRPFTHPLPPRAPGAPDHQAFQALRSERRREGHANPEALNMGIWDTKTYHRLAFIGFSALYPDDTDKRIAEIGCRIAKQYQGLGYATIATQTIIDYARQQRGIEIITGTLKSDNLASRALVERLGFELTERRHDSLIFTLPNLAEQD